MAKVEWQDRPADERSRLLDAIGVVITSLRPTAPREWQAIAALYDVSATALRKRYDTAWYDKLLEAHKRRTAAARETNRQLRKAADDEVRREKSAGRKARHDRKPVPPWGR